VSGSVRVRMDPEQDASLRRRAQGRGTAQVCDERKFRPPDSQELGHGGGRGREADAWHLKMDLESEVHVKGTLEIVAAKDRLTREPGVEGGWSTIAEDGRGESNRDTAKKVTRGQEEQCEAMTCKGAEEHDVPRHWGARRGTGGPRDRERSSKTKLACMADLGSDIWEAVRRRIALDCVQEVHMVKVSNMKAGARGESTSREEHVIVDTHVQREVRKEGQGQSLMERAGEDGRGTNSTVQVEAVCADNRLPLSVAAMSLSRADRGAVTLSLQKRRQASNVNKLFSAAEDLESRKGGLLQATCCFRCPRGLLCRYVKDSSWVDYGKWQYANSSFQDAVMQRVDAIVVEFGAKGEELSYDHGEVDYNEACNTRVEVERRHSQVEGSGVDDFTHARGGCRVERGRTSK